MKVDQVSLKRCETAHPALREELKHILYLASEALTGRAIIRYAYVIRTFEEQDTLYNKIPRVTKAKAGQSFHNYGLAVDIVLLIDKDGNGTYESASWDSSSDFDGDSESDWMEVVKIFKSFGWKWGGDFKSFKDKPHFEKTFGYSWQELLELRNSGKVDEAGYVVIEVK